MVVIDFLILVACMNSITIVPISNKELFNICYNQAIIRECDEETEQI